MTVNYANVREKNRELSYWDEIMSYLFLYDAFLKINSIICCDIIQIELVHSYKLVIKLWRKREMILKY